MFVLGRPAIASAADLATRISQPRFHAVRELYDLRRISASRLIMSRAGWDATSSVMRLPRESVENQTLVSLRDRLTGQEALVNTIRGSRSAAVVPATPPDGMEFRRASADCRWCGEWHVRRSEMWRDDWDHAGLDDDRIGTRPNWARQSLISGLAFGDERMHHLEALTESDFVGLFVVGEAYLANARRIHRLARYAMLYINGGPKSASSVEHAHVQIVARKGRHFAYAEEIASRVPPDYWHRVRCAHEHAGLAVGGSGCSGWASLIPVKERDITATSRDVEEGARFMYRVWRRLARHGTRDFSLAAILSPGYLDPVHCPERFAHWPKVLWRFVDRGDPVVRHGDIGTMELFGSPVVASDPYHVARLLRDAQA